MKDKETRSIVDEAILDARKIKEISMETAKSILEEAFVPKIEESFINTVKQTFLLEDDAQEDEETVSVSDEEPMEPAMEPESEEEELPVDVEDIVDQVTEPEGEEETEVELTIEPTEEETEEEVEVDLESLFNEILGEQEDGEDEPLDRVMSKVARGEKLTDHEREILSAAIDAARGEPEHDPTEGTKPLERVMSKVARGEKLTDEEREILSAAIDAVRKGTKAEAESGEDYDKMIEEILQEAEIEIKVATEEGEEIPSVSLSDLNNEEPAPETPSDEELDVVEALATMAEALNSVTAERDRLLEEVENYKKVVVELHKSLTESQLLNTKLVHVTKLFNMYPTINNDRKKTIIEKFEEAQTAREVKLLFEALTESLAVLNEQQKEETPAVLPRMKPLASGTPSVPAPKKEKETLTEAKLQTDPVKELLQEVNDIRQRMRKLANIR